MEGRDCRYVGCTGGRMGMVRVEGGIEFNIGIESLQLGVEVENESGVEIKIKII